MFLTEDGKTWEPYKIRPIKKTIIPNGADTEMGGTDGEAKKDNDEEVEFEEDIESDEGAVYPLTGMLEDLYAFGLVLTYCRGTHYQHAGFPGSTEPCPQYSQSDPSYSHSPRCPASLDRPRPRVPHTVLLREIQDTSLLHNG